GNSTPSECDSKDVGPEPVILDEAVAEVDQSSEETVLVEHTGDDADVTCQEKVSEGPTDTASTTTSPSDAGGQGRETANPSIKEENVEAKDTTETEDTKASATDEEGKGVELKTEGGGRKDDDVGKEPNGKEKHDEGRSDGVQD
ncbi:unnamed protein product, partial [Symbiodinium sp. KB8]